MSASETVHRTLSLTRTDTIPASARVRHVDELSEDALTRFYEALESESRPPASEDVEFVDGEIIVFTEYYRVELE